jgi:hypothetical protein
VEGNNKSINMFIEFNPGCKIAFTTYADSKNFEIVIDVAIECLEKLKGGLSNAR